MTEVTMTVPAGDRSRTRLVVERILLYPLVGAMLALPAWVLLGMLTSYRYHVRMWDAVLHLDLARLPWPSLVEAAVAKTVLTHGCVVMPLAGLVVIGGTLAGFVALWERGRRLRAMGLLIGYQFACLAWFAFHEVAVTLPQWQYLMNSRQ